MVDIPETSALCLDVISEVEKAIVGKEDRIGDNHGVCSGRGSCTARRLPRLGKTLIAKSFRCRPGIGFQVLPIYPGASCPGTLPAAIFSTRAQNRF